MEPNPQHIIDLSKLPPAIAQALRTDLAELQAAYGQQKPPHEEWLRLFDHWVESHHAQKGSANDSRDDMYDWRGE